MIPSLGLAAMAHIGAPLDALLSCSVPLDFPPFTMPDQDPERWQKLCSLAAKEQDPKKMLELTEEILRLLDAKRQRLNSGGKAALPPKAS